MGYSAGSGFSAQYPGTAPPAAQYSVGGVEYSTTGHYGDTNVDSNSVYSANSPAQVCHVSVCGGALGRVADAGGAHASTSDICKDAVRDASSVKQARSSLHAHVPIKQGCCGSWYVRTGEVRGAIVTLWLTAQTGCWWSLTTVFSSSHMVVRPHCKTIFSRPFETLGGSHVC